MNITDHRFLLDESWQQFYDVLAPITFIVSLKVGLIGFFLHCYTAFAYQYQRSENLTSLQSVIFGVSIFYSFYCFSLIIHQLLHFKKLFNCFDQSFWHTLFNVTSPLVELLLCLNRFYSVCKPPYRYMWLFTPKRIGKYFILIGSVTFLFLSLDVSYCAFDIATVPGRVFDCKSSGFRCL